MLAGRCLSLHCRPAHFMKPVRLVFCDTCADTTAATWAAGDGLPDPLNVTALRTPADPTKCLACQGATYSSRYGATACLTARVRASSAIEALSKLQRPLPSDQCFLL